MNIHPINLKTYQSIPRMYGAYPNETDDGEVRSGTSFAAPAIAAAAVIMRSNGLHSYTSARDIFHGMDRYSVCHIDSTRIGYLVDAWYAHYSTRWTATSKRPSMRLTSKTSWSSPYDSLPRPRGRTLRHERSRRSKQLKIHAWVDENPEPTAEESSFVFVRVPSQNSSLDDAAVVIENDHNPTELGTDDRGN